MRRPGGTRGTGGTETGTQRLRTDAATLEERKDVVAEIPTSAARPATLRVSLLPGDRGVFVDLRAYLAGRPTRQGVLIRVDLVPAVIAALHDAEGWLPPRRNG